MGMNYDIVYADPPWPQQKGGIRKKILCKGYKVNEDPKNYIDEKLTNAFGAEYDGLISIKHLQKEEEAQSTAQEAV